VIVLDHTTVLLVASEPRLAELAVHAPSDPRDRLVVPLLCLAHAQTASGTDSPVADDLGALAGLDFAALDFPAFHHIEQLTARGVPWEAAHAVHVIQSSGPTSLDHADSVVITTTPKLYQDHGVMALDLGRL
jgi:hypothetical protein